MWVEQNCEFGNQCLLKETALTLNAGKVVKVEERQIRWTTYGNLKLWFDSWETDLLQLGFAEQDDKGTMVIPEEQMKRILNLDETCLSLDGTEGNRGGRPSVVFFDASMSRAGTPSSKSSVTHTMITGATASNETLPPHFQFSTRAKTDEHARIKLEVMRWMKDVRGRFGNGEEKVWPVTLGMNEKGGMDTVEFEKYIFGSIVPLYDNSVDIPGRRVMIKIDSGPGRMNGDLTSRLQNLGFYLFPGLPNSTHVTQDTDQLYGPFKSNFQKNLERLYSNRLSAENRETRTLQKADLGLLIFGGKDTVTNTDGYIDAFAKTFDYDHCINAFKKIGAAPLTRACLASKEVRHEAMVEGEEDDAGPQTVMLLNLEEQNKMACNVLSLYCYRGELLLKEVKKRNMEGLRKRITVAHTKER